MKNLVMTSTGLIFIQLLACCTKKNGIIGQADNVLNTDSMKLKITIGTNSFTATLYQNETTAVFKQKLPISLNMTDLNANEKYYDLPYNLPANASNPGMILPGDLMLYGSNTLVLFYKSFSTSYNYTKITRIDNPSGLATALGSGNINVTVELQ